MMIVIRNAALVAVLALSACSKEEAGGKTGDTTGAKADGTAAKASDAAAKPAAAADAGAAAKPADAGPTATAAVDAAAGTAATPADGAAKPDDSPPKNLKVLPKKWSRKQVNDFMKKEVGRGLGVKCDHCHVKNDFASDDNEHKLAARKMMKMTNTMNKKFFDGKKELSCFTCHKGKEEPGK